MLWELLQSAVKFPERLRFHEVDVECDVEGVVGVNCLNLCQDFLVQLGAILFVEAHNHVESDSVIILVQIKAVHLVDVLVCGDNLSQFLAYLNRIRILGVDGVDADGGG